MLVLSTFIVVSLTLPTDTVVVEAGAALRMAEEVSLTMDAASLRVERATHEIAEARSFSIPQFEAIVENVGAEDPALGPGLNRMEGQLILSSRLRVGGERGAGMALARARHDASAGENALVRAEVRAGALESMANAARDRRLLRQTEEERLAIERFTESLRLGASVGRFAAGDAARAEGALVLATTEEARRRAALALSEARLALALGLDAGTPVHVPIDRACAAPTHSTVDDASQLPQARISSARLSEADAALALSRARAIPDLQPQFGVRRSGGVDGLYLGVAFDLPFFGGTLRRTAAARAEREAVAAERSAFTRALDSERAAAGSSVAALESASAYFSGDWEAALDLSVGAALANYELGEGSLGDLLQARQARLAALRDHAVWLAELQNARIEAARLGLLPLNEDVFCTAQP